MNYSFTETLLQKKFSTNEKCLDVIRQIIYPRDSACEKCFRLTTYYKVKDRTAYTCKFCRHQVFPLKNTVFEKSSTPLLIWFYAMYLLTRTRGFITIKQLQKELGVTYKTAWRMYTSLYRCMEQNNADLIYGKQDIVKKWVFFNKVEITFAQRRGEKK